jgi:prolyl oligopeptidase
MKFPDTRKEDIVDTLHGQSISDPYRWLENTEDAETQTWLDEQGRYARSILDALPARNKLAGEFEKLFREDSIGFPHPRGGQYFFVKRKADEDLPVLYVKQGLSGEPRKLLDMNEISKEKGFPVKFAGYSVSKDGSLITYRLSEAANDKANTFVMDVATGKNLPDVISGDFYPTNGSWSLDNSGFWYTRGKNDVPKGEEKFYRRIYYHKLGAPFLEDEMIFGGSLKKEDFVTAYETYDGRYLILNIRMGLFRLLGTSKGMRI